MENVNGYVKFQNHYGRVHVQLSGNCKTWRSNFMPEEGGWLSTDVFVDTLEQNWHANLKILNLFVPVRYKVKLASRPLSFLVLPVVLHDLVLFFMFGILLLDFYAAF